MPQNPHGTALDLEPDLVPGSGVQGFHDILRKMDSPPLTDFDNEWLLLEHDLFSYARGEPVLLFG